ncbi:hypothetical protein AB4Y33_43515, partial [Paraburkholderia sp. BR14319]|uniref:hypothetical protein n=1 Tax=Paraburkholderia sp. BR14319 TaxID=3237005 RepID=UPI0034D1AE28
MLTVVETDAMPVDEEVDSDATLLLVVDRPVESELTPVDSELPVVEADVESEDTELLALDKPVDSE